MDSRINRRIFLKGGIVSSFSLGAALSLKSLAATQGVVAISTPPLQEFSYGAVQFADGLHQQQLDDTLAVLLGLSEDSLLKPFRVRAGLAAPGADLGGWYDEDPSYNLESGNEHGFAPGHSFGQWVSALTRYYAINNSLAAKEKAERLIALYAKTISPKFYDGFRWPTYTFDKLNLGLIDAHKYLGLKDAFAILDKTTDTALPFFPGRSLDHDEMRKLPHKNESYCWDESYTISENLFIAFNRGAGERYRKLAIQYLKDDTYFNPLAEGKNVLPDHHAYSYVNALSSAMQAYLTLGSEKHLHAATNAMRMLQETQSFATGGWGPDEALRKPDSNDMADSLTNSHHSFETPCGSYAHFKLTRYLLRVSRDSKYGDSMERVMYNTVLGAKKLQADGQAFYYSDYNFAGKKEYHKSKWTCCSGTLPQVVTDYRICTYFRDKDSVYVNLYIPSTLKWDIHATEANASGTKVGSGSGNVEITQKGGYPFDEQIELSMTISHPTEFKLHLRIPIWAEGASIRINGNKVTDKELLSPATAGSFACIQRKWENADRVELELPMKLRLQALDARHPNLVALVRGPLVLFPICNGKPVASKESLLAAKRSGKEEWSMESKDESIKLLPFTSIDDEQYSTYFQLLDS